MTKAEAARMLAVLAAAFRVELAEDNAEVWYHAALVNVDAQLGMDVVERIIEHDQRFPTPARFNEVRRAVERAQEPATKALPEAKPDEVQHKRFLAMCRQALKKGAA